MKDSLFEMLMNFFEKSLTRLKESSKTNEIEEEPEFYDAATLASRTLVIGQPQATSMRIFTDDEKQKLTKASYQFLNQLIAWDIISSETLELIISQLLFSESRFVNLQETKWTIRNTLAENLNTAQLAFLDLVLYQKEDKLPLH